MPVKWAGWKSAPAEPYIIKVLKNLRFRKLIIRQALCPTAVFFLVLRSSSPVRPLRRAPTLPKIDHLFCNNSQPQFAYLSTCRFYRPAICQPADLPISRTAELHHRLIKRFAPNLPDLPICQTSSPVHVRKCDAGGKIT